MGAEKNEEALEIVLKRGIDLILICPNSAEINFYSLPTGKAIFYEDLVEDRMPSWLKEVELPQELKKKFRLFSFQKKDAH